MNKLFAVVFLLFTNTLLAAPDPLLLKGSFSGKVIDAATGKPLSGVSVYISDTRTGTTTNAEGTFFIGNISEGNHLVEFSHVGFSLAALGASDCYASPFIKARTGSRHGYDIVDHNAFNPEIGSREEFEEFARELQFHGMNLLLDVVPNHMGVATDENAWWNDVLENGRSSPYASWFDIDWNPLKHDLADKVLLPVLGDQFGKVLEDGRLVLCFEDGMFFLRCYDRRLPITPHSWPRVLKYRLTELESRLAADSPHLQEYH